MMRDSFDGFADIHRFYATYVVLTMSLRFNHVLNSFLFFSISKEKKGIKGKQLWKQFRSQC